MILKAYWKPSMLRPEKSRRTSGSQPKGKAFKKGIKKWKIAACLKEEFGEESKV
jgi:hypothetical protein